jgi:ribosomal protein S17
MAKSRLPMNEMIGYVDNDKHPKTVRVSCDRYMYVVRYKKSFRYSKHVWAHDENNSCQLGDVVRVQPLGYRVGPLKRYVVASILHKEPRDETVLRGSDMRNLTVLPGPEAEA